MASLDSASAGAIAWRREELRRRSVPGRPLLGLCGSPDKTLATRRERERGVWSRTDADTTLLIRKEVNGILG
jgi:hypothetical protein